MRKFPERYLKELGYRVVIKNDDEVHVYEGKRPKPILTCRVMDEMDKKLSNMKMPKYYTLKKIMKLEHEFCGEEDW